MKPLSRYIVIPALCQALLCTPAMAQKNDKSDDSGKNKKSEQSSGKAKQSSGGGSGGGGQKQQQRPQGSGGGGGGGGQKQQQRPQNQGGGGGGGGGQKQQARKDAPSKPKANPAPSKKQDSGSATRPKAANNQANKGNQGGGGGKKEPMPLPGKRPETANKGNQGDKNRASNDDKPGRRENNDAQAARSEGRAKNNKPMDLPGKRPAVQRVTREERPDARVSGRARNPRDPNAKVAIRPAVVRPGQNSRQVRRVNIDDNRQNVWWNNRKVVNKDVRIVNNTTVINNNFRRGVNWSTRRDYWGYNPWWNRPQVRPWYGSSWNWGWNRNYYHRHYYYGHYHGYRPPGYAVSTAIGWGLIGWSLGTLAYDSGYYSYYNPYPVRTYVSYRGDNISYDQPIARLATRTAPEEDKMDDLNQKSESLIAESQSAFKQKNYLVALEYADKAIGETPGDGALHEYRALILFALGKYGDAAGVLNPVLASGPGWDWSTMIALYDTQQTYTDQLQRLEAYTEEKPDAADTHFLLGYHYMVCGHLDLATPQFELAAKLMPKDSVSRQLADLTRSSASPEESEAAAESTDIPDDAPEPEPVPLEKLEGKWTSTRDDGGTVTLTFKNDGKFTWSYQKDGKNNEFSGDYSMNDNGQLVLDSDESQMVASVDLPQESEMNFVLTGGPPEDPGLSFKKG